MKFFDIILLSLIPIVLSLWALSLFFSFTEKKECPECPVCEKTICPEKVSPKCKNVKTENLIEFCNKSVCK